MIFRGTSSIPGNERTGGKAPRIDDDTAVYAIGDIHGRVDLVRQIHQRIEAHAGAAAAKRRVIVYLGDYVDRGPFSKEVVDLLCADPMPEFETICLKGNHEDFLIRFLEGDLSMGFGWLMNGGIATIQSYGVSPPQSAGEDMLEALRDALDRAVPESHREFMRRLGLYHIEGDYLFVHAGIRPGIPLEDQSEEDLLWIREAFLGSSLDHGRVVVHGHSIGDEPVEMANRVGIDTGAYASGRLTCLALHGARRTFLQTELTRHPGY